MDYSKLLHDLMFPILSLPQDEFWDAFITRYDTYFDSLPIKDVKGFKKDKARSIGYFFEYICIELLKQGCFLRSDEREVWAFKDFPYKHEFGLADRDMGIDIVVKTIVRKNGKVYTNWYPVQCKYRRKPRHTKTPNGQFIKWQVTWRDLSTFYALVQRSTSQTKKWSKYVVMTNAQSINRQGNKTDLDYSICVGSFRKVPKEVWFNILGFRSHTLNDVNVEETQTNDLDELRKKRLAFFSS